MASRIEEIEGIGPAYAEKLIAAGVSTDTELLDQAASAKGRAQLTEKTGISGTLILKWVNHADLMRVSGIGPQYAELLEASGVDTVKELARRNATNLSEKMSGVNQLKHLAGTTPSEAQISGWIEQAKLLGPRISY